MERRECFYKLGKIGQSKEIRAIISNAQSDYPGLRLISSNDEDITLYDSYLRYSVYDHGFIDVPFTSIESVETDEKFGIVIRLIGGAELKTKWEL